MFENSLPFLLYAPYVLILFFLVQATEVPGVKVFRYESSLFFANAENFVNAVAELTGVDPSKPTTKENEIVLKFERMSSFRNPSAEENNSLHSDGEDIESETVAIQTSVSLPNGVSQIYLFVLFLAARRKLWEKNAGNRSSTALIFFFFYVLLHMCKSQSSLTSFWCFKKMLNFSTSLMETLFGRSPVIISSIIK